jgi:two-component system response regulator RegX3
VQAARVLFVEDEDSISEPLSELLRLEGYEPVVARTLADGLALADRVAPDVVLLDLVLPDGSGRDLCRELRRRSDVPILILTARGQVHERIIGLEIGADDYVVKPFDGGEVIARIGAVLRRSQRARAASRPPETADTAQRIGHLVIDRDARRVWNRDGEVQLSRKEFDLLSVLARQPGRVVRREDLMAQVWDENWWGSTRTLDVHVGTLRRKLETGPGADRLVQTVRGVGFRLCLPEDGPSA